MGKASFSANAATNPLSSYEGPAEPTPQLRWSLRHRLQQRWSIPQFQGVQHVGTRFEWRDVPYEEATSAQTQPLPPHTNVSATPESVAEVRDYILSIGPTHSTEPKDD